MGQEPFYKKSYQDRLTEISERHHLTAQETAQLMALANERDGQLVENYLTTYGLPEGIATGIRVNGVTHDVPMVVEEPSVIAAASNGGKMTALGGGMTATVLNRQLTGQIVFQKVTHPADLAAKLTQLAPEILKTANAAHPSVLTHGAGATDIRVRPMAPDWVSLDLQVDVGEAMGANTMNTMLEAVAAWLTPQVNAPILMSILSNYATECLTTATVKIPVAAVATKTLSGATVAAQIAAASQFAKVDSYRAATHNKGIMNGVDAVLIAMGNDWRAAESGIHAYAARNGQYEGLSTWRVENEMLSGELTLPLAVGFVGGAINMLPLSRLNQQIAGVETARELMMLAVSVGLAQNLSALRALVSDGIQQGHMRLQYKSLAVTAGATTDEVPTLVAKLTAVSHADLATAQELLQELRQE
ncbi:hydroxymethylglutaryl-CoA reductase, degradative [Levilactobacillus bambusae]|uniref:hydroxymethylglutaryl-CoA reductase, degradative n=1 Tax=Levilactobacillus bambusae TaxID=2024736 RepID=UPI001CDB3709|nr:hydroxymethylglutaryl-CoA reductase, degradative [Levilactobacillus bambusae]